MTPDVFILLQAAAILLAVGVWFDSQGGAR
jgi:hypothetical protein